MTDRARRPTSLIEIIIESASSALEANDRTIIRDMVRNYDAVSDRLRREIQVLESQIWQSLNANGGGDVTDAWVRRQQWFKTLETSIDREARLLETRIGQAVSTTRTASAQTALDTVRTMARAGEFRLVDPPGITRWQGAVRGVSPLGKVLLNYGMDVRNAIDSSMVQGILAGQNNRKITGEVMSRLGDRLTPYQASRIVRTETMRVYRGVFADQMAAFPPGTVTGYRRIAGLDKRTCGACVIMHNHISPYPHDDFHVMCRCKDVPVFAEDYVEPPPGGYPRGEEWLKRQPEDVQKRILGPGRHERWKKGGNLDDMVEFKPDPVWGGTTQLVPLSGSKLPPPRVPKPPPAPPKAPPRKPPARPPTAKPPTTSPAPPTVPPGAPSAKLGGTPGRKMVPSTKQGTVTKAVRERPPLPGANATLDDYTAWYKDQGYKVKIAKDADLDVVRRVSKVVDDELGAGFAMPRTINFYGEKMPIMPNARAYATPGASKRGQALSFNTKRMPDRRRNPVGQNYDEMPFDERRLSPFTYYGDVEATVIHEMGHIRHFDWIRKNGGMKVDFTNGGKDVSWWYRDAAGNRAPWDGWGAYTSAADKRAIAKVSEYGRTEPAEYVAEVYNGLRGGFTFPDDVMELYYRLGGPKP